MSVLLKFLTRYISYILNFVDVFLKERIISKAIQKLQTVMIVDIRNSDFIRKSNYHPNLFGELVCYRTAIDK